MGKKLSEEFIRSNLEKLGYTLLGNYVNSSSTITVKEKCSGDLYKTTWNRIQQGSLPGINHTPINKHSQKYVEDIFLNQGYTLVSEYKNYTANNVLITPSGELWKCSLSHFKSGRRYNDFIGISRGELIIRTILRVNSIRFYSQYAVVINGNKNLFDFYIPSLSVMIEYDGIQHYRPIKKFGGDIEYKRRKARDRDKDNYCLNSGLKLIRVPYTANSIASIYNYINSYISKLSIIPSNIESTSYKKISEHYLKNNLNDTCKEFNLSRSVVLSAFSHTFGMCKRDYTRIDKYKKPAEDFLNGKSKEYIKENYGVDALRAFKIIYRMSKNEYFKTYIYPVAALDYLNGKSREYIHDVYHVNAQNAFKFVYKVNIKEYRLKHK